MTTEQKPGVTVAEHPPVARTGSWLSLLLAAVAQLLLLDAAVETFLSGSALRWWIVLPAVAWVALCVFVLVRRGTDADHGARGQIASALSFIGLLLLLALPAWLPGGSTDGLRLAGQPTSTVFAVATMVAVLLAALALVRVMDLVPASARLAARAIVILLAVYALASLAFGLRDHVPYHTLLNGGAAWQRLPRSLQGAFIGGLVLLPVAILAQIGRIFGHMRRGQPIRVLLHQAVALVLAFVMTASGLGRPASSLMGSGSLLTPSPHAETAAAAFGRLQQDWKGEDPVAVGERFSQAAEEELNAPGADPSNVDEKAGALNRDPQKVFAFLRNEVTLEPYSGVLRGARGTLAAGAGNSLDRALLARELLKEGGPETRLVAGNLSDAQAEQLLARYLSTKPVGQALASCVGPSDQASIETGVRDAAAKAGISPEHANKIAQHATATSQSFWSTADQERNAQFDFLADQLRRGGVNGTTDVSATKTQLLNRLKEHYWLQLKDDNGNWTDFDPSFADAQPGTAYGGGSRVLDNVPEEMFHRFEFSLVYDTKSQGVPVQTVLVTRAVTAADALSTPLEFRIQAGDAANSAAITSMDAKQKAAALRKVKRLQPLLRAGSQIVPGRAFDLQGNTYEVGGAAPTNPNAGMLGGLFGGMSGGEEQKPAEPGGPSKNLGDFVDLHVVLRLTGPGTRATTQTRVLVQAGDLKTANFAPPLMEWEILPQPQWISASLAGHQMLTYLVAVQKGMLAAIKAHQTTISEPAPPIPQQLLQLALLRQRVTVDVLSKYSGVHAFIDHPLLTIAGHRLAAVNPDEGRIDAVRSIDIVENSVSYVANDEAAQSSAFDAALRQSAADCTLEALFLAEAYPETMAKSGATVLRNAQMERKPMVLAGSRDAGRLQDAGIDASDVEWIRSNEPADARLLITKASMGPAAWWSVRPDGNAVLRMSGGQGAAMARQELAEHETDVMLISLKIMFGMVCGYEVSKAGEEGGLGGFKIAFCIAAGGASLGFVIAEIHAASWVLIGVEVVEYVGTGIWEAHEK